MPEWLSIVLTAVGVLVPVGTMLNLATKYGRTSHAVDALHEDVREIKAAIPMCQKERRAKEDELHSRITEMATILSAQQERMAGTTSRVQRLERTINGQHGK